MSFLKSLFGWRSSSAEGAEAAPETGKAVEYKGFVIRPAPFKSEGQYQTAGTIEKEVGGERREHKFIRAERHPTSDEAAEFALIKGRQIVDEQGERIFR